MIRDGYELEPSQIELAVAWLNTNGMDRPVPMAEAIKPLAKHGGDRKSEDYQVDNINLKTKGGTDTEHPRRRLGWTHTAFETNAQVNRFWNFFHNR